MMNRLLKRMLSGDVIGMILVLIALNILAYGISASLRNTDSTYFYYACMFAGVIGLGLSKTKCNGIQASAWVVALGISGVWTLGANLLYPLSNFIRVAFTLIPQIIPAIRSQITIDTTLINAAWFPIAQSSTALWERLQTWLIGLTRSVIVNDDLVRNMVWLLVLWLVSAWAGWFMRKRNAVLTLMPSIALLALVASYSERKIESVWMIMCVLLLLMGAWNYKNHTRQWEIQKFDYSESISFDVTQAVLLVSIFIAALAFFTPSISWREIRDQLREWNRPSKNETAEMLGIQQPVAPAKNIIPYHVPPLPREHLLSGGFANSEKVVMTIQTGELPPMPYASNAVIPPRYYWRSVTYDRYIGAGWETSSAPPQSFQANSPLIPGFLTGYKLLHLDVEMQQPEGKLFWSGMLSSADVPLSVNWRVRPQSGLFPDQSALLQADIFAAATKADAFRVDSYVPIATLDALRAASTEYPDEVASRYLVLPDSVPERVQALAREITQGQANPYEKAKAIERYLRTKYPYDLNVPVPPDDQDIADYFLFDLKKGYCDYFATAMVVLARSSGLPARFVSGYAPGSYDSINAQYIVREMDAHSWAEVYFPEVGWVEFEPTASVPEIERAQPNELAQALEESQTPTQKLLLQFHLQKAIYWILPFVGILALFILYFAFLEKWMVVRLAPALAIERLHRRYYRLGRPLVGNRTRAETASEFLVKLLNKVDELNEGSRFTKILSVLQSEAATLTNIYHASLFTDHRIKKKDAYTAWHSWRRLRWRLLFARILFNANRMMRK
jgi:transglutaminase-like putative cysteine protease